MILLSVLWGVCGSCVLNVSPSTVAPFSPNERSESDYRLFHCITRSDSSPGVLAVAVAFAKVIVAYEPSTGLEFEIRDSRRVLVVEYTVP